ncbi:MAG: hypothetical protein SF029_15660 [bacterium]|nr:hypothetical protein [bacterium]
MRKLLQSAGLTIITLLMTACSGMSQSEQALVEQNNALGTQIADLRASATVSSDLLMATLEQANTSIARVNQQQDQMIGTLRARGMAPEAGAINPLMSTATPTFAAQTGLVTPVAPGGGVTPFGTSSSVQTFGPTPGAPVPNPALTPGTTPLPASTTTTSSGGSNTLTNIVTSSGVGADDCAASPSSQFTTSTQEIYVVATANLTSGTTVLSRWLQNGTEVATFDFTYEFNVSGSCIWFFANQSDFAFTPGSYTVSLEVNGVVAGQTTFTIQ